MKFSRRIFPLLIFLFCLFFLFYPFYNIKAKDLELGDLDKYIKISSRDTKALLFTLPDKLTQEWVDLTISSSNYNEQAILMLLRKAVRADMQNYMLVEGPKEIAVEFTKIGYKLGKMVLFSDMSELVKEVEKMTVKESLKYLGEWMVEKDVKVAMGDLNFTYESYKKKNETHKFQYVIFYYPESANKGRGIMKIYSSKLMNSPKSRGSLGSMTGVTWLAEDEVIEPFILTIEGEMKRKQIGWWQSKFMHQYSWLEHPDISIFFSKDVPYFEFKQKGFFEKWGDKIKGFFNNIGSWLSPASVVKPPNINFEEEEEENLGSGIFSEIKDLLANIVKQLKLLADNLSQQQQQEIKKEIKEIEEEEDYDELAEKLRKLENQLDKMLKEIEEFKKEENSASTEEEKKIKENKEDKGLVINEVCAGFDKANNEFIELYNPTDFAIGLEDYLELVLVSSSNKETKKQLDFYCSEIPSKGHYLLVGGELAGLSPDAEYSSQLSSASGVIIRDKEGNVLDKVSWGSGDKPAPESAIEGEGKMLEKGLLTGYSLSRLDFIDTNNNNLDFELSDSPTPVNSLGEAITLESEEEDEEEEEEEEEDKEDDEDDEDEEEAHYSSGGGGGSNSSSVSYCSQNNLSEPSYFPVVINEIAWMGTEESHNNEWIELKNISTTTINLNDWQLLDKDEQIKVIFSEDDIIQPNQFYLLERTDDDTLPDILADKIYSGVLGNSEETLRLFNSNCDLIDEVIATTTWPAGDNEDKKTMERNEDLNWHTCSDSQKGTPGEENSQLIENGQENGQNNNGQNNEEQTTATTTTTTTATTTATTSKTTIHNNLLITEVRAFGDKEFIELYNPTDEEVSLNNLWLSYYSKDRDWNNPFLNTNFATSTIAPKTYYLIGFGDFLEKNCDFKPYKSNLSDDNGSIALFSGNPKNASTSQEAKDLKIDALGWGETLVKEKEPAVVLEDKSLSRKIEPDTEGKLQYIDTDNNLNDFEAQTSTPGAINLHNYSDLDNDGIIDSYDATTTISATSTLEAGEYYFNNLEIIENGCLNLLSNPSLSGFKGVKIIANNIIIDFQAQISADKNGYKDKIAVEKDYLEPKTLGSAGADNPANQCCLERPGGNGGGAIILEIANVLNIKGIISANGEDGLDKGSYGCAATDAGNGGSIYITTDILKGNGLIEANGGNGYTTGDSGNGGQIALYFQKNQFIGKANAYGGKREGQIGNTGTVYVNSSNSLFLKNIDIRGVYPLNKDLTGLAELVFATTTLEASSSLNMQADNFVLKNTVFSNEPKEIFNISAKDINLFNSNIKSNLDVKSDNFLIDQNSIVSANALGYQTDEGPGCGTTAHSGGSYGGIGGGNSTTSIYGTSSQPLDFGSGGKGNPRNCCCLARPGGAGGGKIIVELSGNLIIDGELTANGEDGLDQGSYGCAATGGGSGGSIYLTLNQLTGSGFIEANGGNAFSVGRAGGGGRIAIYGDVSSFNGLIEANTGIHSNQSYQGTDGTVFIK